MLPVKPVQFLSMLTRDGVRLDADLYQPDIAGDFPVLLMRQPYGRRIASTVCYAHPAWYAAQGYNVIIQDVRGRGSSAGRFALFAHDREDGADTIRWAAQLPGSNGRVGMYGFSYQGTNQLLAANEAEPALQALAPAMIGWDLRLDWAYENDAFCLAAGLGWAIQLAAESARLAGDETAFQELYQASRALPLSDPIPARPAVMARNHHYCHYFDWLDRPADDVYWRELSPCRDWQDPARPALPMLFIGGWYDSHLPGTLAAFRSFAARADGARHKLWLGPWGHFPWGQKLGGLDFGPEAISPIDRLQIDWFDHWLKGIDNRISAMAPITLFDMGQRQWRTMPRWPEPSVQFYLGGNGLAGVDPGAGTLLSDPGDLVQDRIVHDPWRPAPTIGGAFGTPSGPIDRSAIDCRTDVLTFTTPALTAPLRLAGSLATTLYIDSDSPSFDVVATVSRVTEAGQVLTLVEGIRHVSERSPSGAVVIPLRATCITLMPGERLRLSLAAASFPAYSVNPGTGQDPTTARQIDAKVITLTLQHGGDRLSHLCLAVDA